MPKVVNHEERRQRIIDGMWQIVDRDGWHAVSVRSIAAEVGLSKSTLAHYFTSQDALIDLAVEQTIANTTAAILELDIDNCTPEVATAAITMMIPMSADARRRSDVWLSLIQRDSDEPSAALTHLNETVRDAVLTLLTALAERRYIPEGTDLHLEATRLHATIDGVSIQTMSDPTSMPPTLIEDLIRSAIDALCR